MNTNKFNPEMLQLAREAMGLTRGDFAKLLGAPQPKITRFEDGIVEPSDADLVKFSEILGQPKALFLQGGPARSQSPVSFFRKTTALPLKSVTQFNARMNLRRLEILRLCDSRKLRSTLSIPTISVNSTEAAESAADELRRWWRLPRGPIRNLTMLVEQSGCVVELFDFGIGKIDGLAIGVGEPLPIVFLNSTFPGDRRRFSLAHEVGHLVMHKTVTETVEEEAHVFAGALLMPKADIEGELYPLNVERLIALKEKWGCSMQAILKRASRLHKINERYERFMWMTLGRLGYRTSEPGTTSAETSTPIEQRIKESNE